MAVAKIAPYNFGNVKKKIKKVVKKFFAPPSNAPGQMDYPAVPRMLKEQRRRGKLLNKIGK